MLERPIEREVGDFLPSIDGGQQVRAIELHDLRHRLGLVPDLEAAQACFLRNGFHNTSMQDVIAEAGLSMGAVYRYFRSKNELIVAIAKTVTSTADEMLDEVETRESLELIDALERAVHFIESHVGPDGTLRLALQVWAESLRDPELAHLVAHEFTSIRGRFVRLARRAQDVGELSLDADPEAVGAVMFGMLPGYALQRLLAAGPDPQTYIDGVRGLHQRLPR